MDTGLTTIDEADIARHQATAQSMITRLVVLEDASGQSATQLAGTGRRFVSTVSTGSVRRTREVELAKTVAAVHADDPLMQYEDGEREIKLYNPAKPIIGQEPFLVLDAKDVFGRDAEWKIFPEMREIARRAFLVLEKAWSLQGGRLVDFKVRILTSGTEAVTRVLIESADGKGNRWFTVGVDANIVNASFEALYDSIVYKLHREGAPAAKGSQRARA